MKFPVNFSFFIYFLIFFKLCSWDHGNVGEKKVPCMIQRYVRSLWKAINGGLVTEMGEKGLFCLTSFSHHWRGGGGAILYKSILYINHSVSNWTHADIETQKQTASFEHKLTLTDALLIISFQPRLNHRLLVSLECSFDKWALSRKQRGHVGSLMRRSGSS